MKDLIRSIVARGQRVGGHLGSSVPLRVSADVTALGTHIGGLFDRTQVRRISRGRRRRRCWYTSDQEFWRRSVRHFALITCLPGPFRSTSALDCACWRANFGGLLPHFSRRRGCWSRRGRDETEFWSASLRHLAVKTCSFGRCRLGRRRCC